MMHSLFVICFYLHLAWCLSLLFVRTVHLIVLDTIIPFESTSLPKPDITISYEGLFDKKDFSLPNFIKASSGSTTLEIEYTSADQNPKNMTVKIKMPK